MNFKEWLTVLIALVWFVGATVIALANVGGSWDSKELAAWQKAPSLSGRLSKYTPYTAIKYTPV